MEQINEDVVSGFKKVISEFLSDRLEGKKKTKKNEIEGDKKKILELERKYVPSFWIPDAARRVSQLVFATHISKAIHPDSQGSSLSVDLDSLSNHGFVGSYLLQGQSLNDVVGNAAALDVYGFLSLQYHGVSLLSLLMKNAPEAPYILSDDPSQGKDLALIFSEIVNGSKRDLTSHLLSKQVYWMALKDPVSDEDYHLLLPLFESSLVYKVHQAIHEDLYGDKAKAARRARKEKQFSENEIHEYTNLAMRKIGGTKPQNISQLNSARSGVNYLLASCPPSWIDRPAAPIFGKTSFFDHAGQQPEIRSLIMDFRKFLESDPSPNMDTRMKRDDFVEQIIGKIFIYLEKIYLLEPEWSSDSRCQLTPEEKFLVDPKGSSSPPLDWKGKIIEEFARWMIHEVGKNLLLGDVEYDYFRDAFEGLLWNEILESALTEDAHG